MYRLRGYEPKAYRPDKPEPDNAGGGIIAEAALLLVHLSDIKGGAFFMSENRFISTNREKIMAVASGGICLALAEVLSLLKLFEMPQGGAVTLASMLPIILYGLCFGPVWGFGVAFLYSVLQLAIGAYFLSPMQVLLDYTLAFSALGLASFFAAKVSTRIQESNILNRLRLIPLWKILLAALVALSGRLLFSFISGIVFYGSYAPAGQAVWIYSLLYNGTYLIPEAGITVIALFALLATLNIHTREEPLPENMSLIDWLLTFAVSVVPVFGQIFLLVWAFDVKTKQAKKTWAQCVLIVLALLFLIWLIVSVVHQHPVTFKFN